MDNSGKTATDENRKIVEQIVKSQMLSNIVKQITNNSSDDDLNDLMQDLLFSLLLDAKLPGIYERGELNFYLARLVMNNIASVTSPFYRIYKRPRKVFEPMEVYLGTRHHTDTNMERLFETRFGLIDGKDF